MQELSNLFEELLNENPNQAVKFLKDKKLDPATNSRGKQILDSILNFTRGDGYTYLLTRFYVNERMPLDELQKLHEYLRTNKEHLNRLTKPVVQYETYRELRNHIDYIEGQRTAKRLYNQLSPELKQQINKLSIAQRQALTGLSKKFELLTPDQQRHFIKKVFGYKDIKVFVRNLQNYIFVVENKTDYNSLKQKIEATPDANLIYDNPEQDILIAHINSFEASKTLGCTSAWCITRDTVRFREYKKGGNIYFFIWDFNYPINNSNFFIATAYNPARPYQSRTHEHLEDKQIILADVMENKKLSHEIFNNYIEEFKKSQLASQADSTGLMKAFYDKDEEKIIELIENSKEISKFNKTNDISVYRDVVSLGLNKDQMIKMLDLGEEFDYIVDVAHQYGGNNDSNSEESDYMYSGLVQDNIDLLIDLARKMGISKTEYDKFGSEEKAISSFLNKYGMESIADDYIYEYGQAQNVAEKNAAEELLKEIPFYIDDGSFNIHDMLVYVADNNITADNFDGLIAQIKDKLPEFTYDSVSDARYNDLDLDELNRVIKKDIEKIIDDIETDENNPYFNKALTIRIADEKLQKMGFKILPTESENYAELITRRMKITINDIRGEEADDGRFIVSVTATIKHGKNARKIKVPLESLKNYIGQLEIPEFLQERLRRIKSVAGLTELFEELYGDEKEEHSFSRPTPLEKQFSTLVVKKLIDKDEIVAYKWSTYNALMFELEINEDFNIIKEIEYRITDGEKPDKVFLDVIPRAKQTTEINRLKDIIYELKDVQSEDDLEQDPLDV